MKRSERSLSVCLANPRAAERLIAAHRFGARMPSWKRERYMDEIYRLRTYFLEMDYAAMGREEFVEFWKKHRKFIEAVFRWDYGRDFFRAWVLTPKLPLFVSAVLFKAAVDIGIVHVECPSCKCTEDEMALLSRIGGLNPSGVLILLDLYGKDAMTQGVVRQLIQRGRADVLSLFCVRHPGTLQTIEKPDELAQHLLGARIGILGQCRAVEFMEGQFPGALRRQIVELLNQRNDREAWKVGVGREAMAKPPVRARAQSKSRTRSPVHWNSWNARERSAENCDKRWHSPLRGECFCFV